MIRILVAQWRQLFVRWGCVRAPSVDCSDLAVRGRQLLFVRMWLCEGASCWLREGVDCCVCGYARVSAVGRARATTVVCVAVRGCLLLVVRGRHLLFVCFDSEEFGASGDDGGVLRKAVVVLSGSARVHRVRLRAGVLDADVAVVDRLVNESEIGADVT